MCKTTNSGHVLRSHEAFVHRLIMHRGKQRVTTNIISYNDVHANEGAAQTEHSRRSSCLRNCCVAPPQGRSPSSREGRRRRPETPEEDDYTVQPLAAVQPSVQNNNAGAGQRDVFTEVSLGPESGLRPYVSSTSCCLSYGCFNDVFIEHYAHCERVKLPQGCIETPAELQSINLSNQAFVA